VPSLPANSQPSAEANGDAMGVTGTSKTAGKRPNEEEEGVERNATKCLRTQKAKGKTPA